MVKCSKIYVRSDLQNDSSTDIAVDSSDTAQNKLEMEVMKVNNGDRRAPDTSEQETLGQNLWMLV